MTERTELLRTQIAELLETSPTEIGDLDQLLDHGLDSIRVMQLMETWAAEGITVSFAELAENPTISAWATLLETAAPTDNSA
ncbi:phosphopantetheine-binding protein [Amycolatopsis nigrescens]|uniref:phosphopantetheine-binding protein n=1 Tax=Amycolatopsis nigrescens TaxID=381445 RepID=UPI0003730028|nr:phosphopantetheine-binding protein [Amycolatopsis nigrescens]